MIGSPVLQKIQQNAVLDRIWTTSDSSFPPWRFPIEIDIHKQYKKHNKDHLNGEWDLTLDPNKTQKKKTLGHMIQNTETIR